MNMQWKAPEAGGGIRLTGNLPNQGYQGENNHVQPVLSISVKMIQDVYCLITGVMNSAFVYGSQG